jgi:hypothetical protein
VSRGQKFNAGATQSESLPCPRVTPALLRRVEALKTIDSERKSSAILILDDSYRPKSFAIDIRIVSADEKSSNGHEHFFKNRPKSSGVGVLNSEPRTKSFGVVVQSFARRVLTDAHRGKSVSLEAPT